MTIPIKRASYPAPPGWLPNPSEMPAYHAGKEAFLAGKPLSSTPYSLTTHDAAAWEIGWFEEQGDIPLSGLLG